VLLLYLRSAAANLRSNRATTIINVIGLTLGITCFVIAFAFAEHIENIDRNFVNAERTFVVQQRNVEPGGDTAALFSTSASSSLAKYIIAEAPEVEAVARKAGTETTAQISIDDRHLRLPVTLADPDFLRIFDLRFIDGDGAAALAGANSAVVTAAIAERMFGTRDVVGKVFTVNRRVDVVVRGVVDAPDQLSSASFAILLNMRMRDALQSRAQGAVSSRDTDDFTATRSHPNKATFVLLPADGSLSPEELERRLQAVSERIVLPRGETVAFRVRPLKDHSLDVATAEIGSLGIAPGVPAIQLFFLPGLLILAMACFNYLNLATAMAATRAKEVGLSKALGASSRHVVQKYFLEAVLAVLISFVAALLLAALIIVALRALSGLQITFAYLATPAFVALAAFIVVSTSLAAGAYPALVMSRFSPIDALRQSAKRAGSSLTRNLFIGVQFTLASILLTTVLIMYAQNAAMHDGIWQLGTDPFVQVMANLDSTNIDPDVFAAELKTSPQIKGVTGAATPAWGTPETDRYLRSPAADVSVAINTRFVSYDFFSTLGVDLLAGRSFVRGRDLVAGAETSGDTRRQPGTLGVIIDREALGLLGWSTAQSAIGQIAYQQVESAAGAAAAGTLALEIIGVVDRAPLNFINVGTKANAYHLDPYDTLPIVRLAADDVQGGLEHIKQTWSELTGDLPASSVRLIFLDDQLDLNLQGMNYIATGLLSVVAFGFLVALAGIFGMALFVVSRRRHEIGIRKSLGAGPKQVVGLLLVEFGKPVLVGNLVAWPVAYLLADFYVRWFVVQLSFTPWPFVMSLVIAFAVAWFGVGGQALKASRLIPAQILRGE
jgi:putative ABC transport system permease protein